MIGRRNFIDLLGGAAFAWPFAARAQQSDRPRRVGVLMDLPADSPIGQARVAAFVQGLQEAGWTDGRNLRFDFSWGSGDADRLERDAAALLALAPDVMLASGATTLAVLRRRTGSVPIVFTMVPDPLGAGLISSLARPGGNATGFYVFDMPLGTKWLELLKEIAPRMRRVAVLREPTPDSAGVLAAIQAAAPSFGLELVPFDVHNTGEIERAITTFAREPDGGLIALPAPVMGANLKLIGALAARERLPAIYAYRHYATWGGLIAYGPDVIVEPYRRAAGYADRILKGERPGDLPVQGPTSYALTINLAAAKELGLAIPPTLLVRADEVIE